MLYLSCQCPAISADGRFVAFQSSASIFAPNDQFFTNDIFVRDRVAGTTERVTVSSSGEGADGDSFFPDIRADGRFVVFSSFADNLGPRENTFLQILIHDRSTGTTERVSEDAFGTEGDGDSNLPVVSADGRFVAVESNAANLVPNGNHESHVYVRDRLTGTMERASVDSAGNAANLNADDNAYYEVNSTTSNTRTSEWYGSFTGVPNALSNLKITYKGKNSNNVTQTIAIWNWTTSTWVQLDSRSVDTNEVLIADLIPTGTLADFVSGTTGAGELRVRIRATRNFGSFFASGDLLKIVYSSP